METTLTTEERDALKDAVDQFARRTIAPLAERPEAPQSADTLDGVLAEAEAMGLAGSDDEPTGLGTWEAVVEHGIPGPSLDTLVRLGRANAATAYALHQRALARATCRLAQLPTRDLEPLACAPLGSYGLGRRPLTRWLAGAPADDQDGALLDDLYGPRRSRISTVERGFGGAVLPLRVGPSLQWVVVDRERCRIQAHPNAHGLDELATVALTMPPDATPSTLSEARARTVFTAVAGAHQLALVAIAQGSVEHGLNLARRYAAERHQGGAIIDRHPAVLELLGRARSALVVVDALLARAATTPLNADGFIAALATRSRAMPLLADAANAALQVFGGLGYMREVGAEKVVRDVNHLRAIGGPLGELELMIAEWERLHV